MKLKSFCLEFITVIQINLLNDMATIAENTLIIDSPMDLEAEMCRYNCHTKEELEEVLWNDYGATLVLTFEYEET
nr:MAG TPA: hypothetical protein [Caudoviricetes sp.]